MADRRQAQATLQDAMLNYLQTVREDMGSRGEDLSLTMLSMGQQLREGVRGYAHEVGRLLESGWQRLRERFGLGQTGVSLFGTHETPGYLAVYGLDAEVGKASAIIKGALDRFGLRPAAKDPALNTMMRRLGFAGRAPDQASTDPRATDWLNEINELQRAVLDAASPTLREGMVRVALPRLAHYRETLTQINQDLTGQLTRQADRHDMDLGTLRNLLSQGRLPQMVSDSLDPQGSYRRVHQALTWVETTQHFVTRVIEDLRPQPDLQVRSPSLRPG